MKLRSGMMVCAAGLVALCGCVTLPPGGDQVSSAYAVGDRAQIALDEVVVSMRLAGAPGPYQNLHVGLGALVNPTKTTFYDPYTVEQIVRRLEARIAARVVESLSGLEPQTIEGMPLLRARITSEAQGVVNKAMAQWQHGSEYQVEAVVTALYWTDPSVGRVQQQRRMWW